MRRGQFIVIEGLEGAGKSTTIDQIASLLRLQIDEVLVTREPGGTHVGEVVRTLVKEISTKEPLDSRAELFLFYAARVQLIEHVIRPALARGAWVLADRFDLSTWAYQGGGRRLDLSLIKQLSQSSLADLKPDLTVFLDISPIQGLERAKQRSKADRIEQESLLFFEDVYRMYHEQLKTIASRMMVDASQPIELVQADIKKQFMDYLQKNGYENH